MLHQFASMWVSVVFVGATREHCGDHASSRLCSTLTPASGWRLLDAFTVAFYNDTGLGPETPARFHCCSRWGSLSGSMLQMESTPLRPGGQQPYNGAFRGRRLLAPRPTYPLYNLPSLISLETCVALKAFPLWTVNGIQMSPAGRLVPPTFVALFLCHQSSHCLQLLHLPIWIAIITCLVAFCFSLPSAANIHNMDCYHHLPCGILLLS